MRRVVTSELIPGMITAEDVYSFNNQLVVGRGTELTDELITRLEYYSVLSIRVNDPVEKEPEAVKQPEKTENQTLSYSERIRSTQQFKEFREAFVNTSEKLDNQLHDIIENNKIDTDDLLSSVSVLLSKEVTTIGMFDMLHNLRTYDDLTYVHSMNVSLMANIFGRWLHFSDEDIQVLTLAGLLHDIGKLAVPNNLITKPGKLTALEYNKVKEHAVEGYKVLKSLDIDERIKQAALMHHERCDGCGYPLGYKGDQIPDIAKIISIVDVYDAMTAARVYRGPQCPFKVISIFEDEGLKKYDSRFILPFLENIAQTYMNNRVRLNDGRTGDIVLMRKDNIGRPLLKMTDGSFVDLATRQNLFIEDFV